MCGYWYNEASMAEEQTEKAQVAVYDFDNTSIEGSSPTQLVNRLLLTGKISFWTSLKIGFWGLAYKMRLPQNESWVRGQVFKAFEGQPKEEVDAWLTDFYDTIIEPRFRPKADASMQAHVDAGHTVIVVSASFEPIVLRAMEKHPFTGQVSTRMVVAPDGTYTRQVDGLPIQGEEKLSAIEHWCDGRFGEGNWELAAAYGDHHSDAPMLAASRNPHAVNPNGMLERIAKEKGWPILDWSMKLPK